MDTLLTLGELLVGLVLLLAGAEALVRAASRIAVAWGVSEVAIGLTVVAFGTSLPELLVSLVAGLRDKSDIALGNVVGSNISNIGLVIGLTALVSPLLVERRLARREIPLMLGVFALLTVFAATGDLVRWEGIVFLVGIVGFTALSFFRRRHPAEGLAAPEEPVVRGRPRPFLDLLLLLGGIAAVVGGSELMVTAASATAGVLGVSERVIGLTIVAVGTNLPELATCVVAAWHNDSDLAIGNVVGSNIFNVLCILGVTATTVPLHASEHLVRQDMPVMLGFAVALLVPALLWRRIARPYALLLLAAYIAYNAHLYVNG